MQTTSVLCNMSSAYVASTVRFAHKVKKQRRRTQQPGLKAGPKNDLKTAWIYPRPSGSTAPSHSSRHHSILHGVVGVILSLPSYIHRAPPGFAVLNHHTFPRFRVCSLGILSRTRPISAHVRVNPSSRQGSLDICAACVSTSLRTEGSVPTLRTLDF